MAVSRRDALKSLAAVPALGLTPPTLNQAPAPAAGGGEIDRDDPRLASLAEVVLPAEADRKRALRAFTDWIAGYREGADTDHGYGTTRVRPTGPPPSRNYGAQLAALDAAARTAGSTGFAAASVAARRAVVEAAIAEAKVERLTARPTGAHIATDLMGHYFNSPDGSDLCYRAAIARDACRALPGSDRPPAPLKRVRQ
jgi:hypothetical protein